MFQWPHTGGKGLPGLPAHDDGVPLAEVHGGLSQLGEVRQLGLESPGQLVVLADPVALTHGHYQLHLHLGGLQVEVHYAGHFGGLQSDGGNVKCL